MDKQVWFAGFRAGYAEQSRQFRLWSEETAMAGWNRVFAAALRAGEPFPVGYAQGVLTAQADHRNGGCA